MPHTKFKKTKYGVVCVCVRVCVVEWVGGCSSLCRGVTAVGWHTLKEILSQTDFYLGCLQKHMFLETKQLSISQID